MSRLYEFEFSVKSDVLLAKKFDERLTLSKSFVTILSGVGVKWALHFYPRGVEYTNTKVRSEDFNFGISLVYPSNIGSFGVKLHFQVKKDNAEYPNVDPKSFLNFNDLSIIMCQAVPGTLATLTPGGRLNGRVLLHLDPALVSPAALIQAKINAVPNIDYGPIVREMYESTLDGAETLTDTKITCRDGVLRAFSNILRFQSTYFATLFDFNKNADKPELEVDLSAYSVASVGALLSLIHTFALPSLDDFDAAALPELLELAAQVDPKGLHLLKASVEKSLLKRSAEDVATLGEMAKLAEAHGLELLANVTHVRLARNFLHNYQRLNKDISFGIWTKVSAMVENCVDGMAYNMNMAES